MTLSRQQKGLQAEQWVASWLQLNGFVLLESRFQCPFGEIDLIAKQEETIVFIEVRSLHSRTPEWAISSISSAKKEKIKKASLYYLSQHFAEKEPLVRFDVVGMVWGKESKELLHIPFAFF